MYVQYKRSEPHYITENPEDDLQMSKRDVLMTMYCHTVATTAPEAAAAAKSTTAAAAAATTTTGVLVVVYHFAPLGAQGI